MNWWCGKLVYCIRVPNPNSLQLDLDSGDAFPSAVESDTPGIMFATDDDLWMSSGSTESIRAMQAVKG